MWDKKWSLMCLRKSGEFMSIYFHGYNCFTNVSFLRCWYQVIVSVKRGYLWQGKSSLSYKVMIFHFYIVSLTAMMSKHNNECNKKDSFCLFCHVQIHISKIWTLWNKIQGYRLTCLECRTWVIFHFFWYVSIFNLLWIREDVRTCYNKLQPDYLDWVES